MFLYTGDHKSTGLAATYIWVKNSPPILSSDLNGMIRKKLETETAIGMEKKTHLALILHQSIFLPFSIEILIIDTLL